MVGVGGGRKMKGGWVKEQEQWGAYSEGVGAVGAEEEHVGDFMLSWF